jgi:hypothetical protein
MALQDPINDLSLPSASQWKKVHLDRLNAEYDRHLVSEFSFSNAVIPADVQRRIALCDQANHVEIDFVANELAKVNDSNEITVDFEFDSSEHPSISLFFSAFYNLQDILRKKPKHFSLEATLPHTQITPSHEPTTPTHAPTTPPPHTTIPEEKMRTPPIHIIDPANPPPSTTSTASSRESQYETNTHLYVYHFLLATLESLNPALKKFSWFHESYKLKTTSSPV